VRIIKGGIVFLISYECHARITINCEEKKYPSNTYRMVITTTCIIIVIGGVKIAICWD
jgi:hypothetical protein